MKTPLLESIHQGIKDRILDETLVIEPSDKLGNLGLDSLDVVELMMDTEKVLGINLSPVEEETIDTNSTVQEMYNLFDKYCTSGN